MVNFHKKRVRLNYQYREHAIPFYGGTWGVVPIELVDYQNEIPVTWHLRCKRKPDCTVSKFRECYDGVQPKTSYFSTRGLI